MLLSGHRRGLWLGCDALSLIYARDLSGCAGFWGVFCGGFGRGFAFCGGCPRFVSIVLGLADILSDCSRSERGMEGRPPATRGHDGTSEVQRYEPYSGEWRKDGGTTTFTSWWAASGMSARECGRKKWATGTCGPCTEGVNSALDTLTALTLASVFFHLSTIAGEKCKKTHPPPNRPAVLSTNQQQLSNPHLCRPAHVSSPPSTREINGQPNIID